MKFKKIVALLSLTAILAATLFVPNTFAADKTAAETVRAMGIGWNLGNTLEACGSWITPSSVTNYETAWGNVVTTQKAIDGVKAAGFNSVRIPVAWSNLMASDYTINQDLLKRVKEVVDYCSNDGMYAIVNIHWDGGWFEKFATNYDESMKKYTSVWTQISNYFKAYSNTLIFESLNEEGCWDTIWNRWSGSTGADKTRAYTILNNINQKFVDIVRASGGNNTSRCLLIAGYATDIDLTCDAAFIMPKDPSANKLMISVHYYTPSTFTILEKDESWGKTAYTWGTTTEINLVKTDFQKMKNKFANNGVPVIIGEYGSTKVNKDPASVRLYLSTVCQTAYDLGFCPMLWDPGTHYSRTEYKFIDPLVAAIYSKYITSSTPTQKPTPTQTSTPTPTPSMPSQKTPDLNGDGVVNMADIMIVANAFNAVKGDSRYVVGCDFNDDNAVNMSDIMVVAGKFGATVK